MGSAYIRYNKREEHYNISIDTFIERLKKIRALNCSLADIGMDSYVWKKLFSKRSSILKKIL